MRGIGCDRIGLNGWIESDEDGLIRRDGMG